MSLPKLLIIGESGCGKDELCKILSEHYGYKFASASKIACELVVFETLKEKYSYNSIDECHADRRKHIEDWVNIIAEYNTPDGAALAKEVMKQSDIYCGVRKRDEFNAMLQAGIFDCVIYIDSYKRLGKPEQSFVEVTADDANFTVDNNADIKQLIQRAKRAHARAMQIFAMKKPVYTEQGSEVVTRDDLAKATEEEKDSLLQESNKDEVLDLAQSVDKQLDETLEAPEPKAPPVKKQTPRPKAKTKVVNRPAKAPARKPRS